MLNAMMKFGANQFLSYFKFPGQADERSRTITEGVKDAFRCGVHMFPSSREQLEERAASLAWHKREFYWEGYAFAMAGRHALGVTGGTPERFRCVDDYREMHFTGYGFWSGLADVYHLPGISIAEDNWSGVSDFAKYGPLLAGGVTFGMMFGRRSLDDRVLSTLRRFQERGWLEGGLHGVGRSLWFLYMRNPGALLKSIEEFPQFREPLLEGLGMAMGFTQLDDIPDACNMALSFDEPTRKALFRGMSVAWASVEGAEGRSQIAAGLPTRFEEQFTTCGRILGSGLGNESDWYGRCLGQLRAYDSRRPAAPSALHVNEAASCP